MEPIEYLKALRRRWLVVVAAVAVVVPIAYFTATVVAPTGPVTQTYKASTVLLSIGNLQGSNGEANLPTLAALAKLPEVSAAVARDVGYKGDPVALAAPVTLVADTTTGLLTISATLTQPELARRVADSFATELLNFVRARQQQTQTAQIQTLQTQLDAANKTIDQLDHQIAAASGAQLVKLKAQLSAQETDYGQLTSSIQQVSSAPSIADSLIIVQPAVPILVPNTGFQAPRSRKTRVLLAALIALLAGMVLALVVERFDRKIRTKEGAERSYHLPVLAEIPLVRRWRRPKNVIPAMNHPHSTHADAFRLLGAGLAGATMAGNGWRPPNGDSRRKLPRSVLVTSAGPSEGKSTVVANLAATYAGMGKKVLVLSCDFRHPRVHELLGSPNSNGLAEALASANGTLVLSGHIRDTKMAEVKLVPSGARPDRPAMLLAGAGMRRALEEAKEQADIVLLDTPPILASADATELLSEVDRVLIVARAGKTTGELAERTAELLARLGASVAGVVLNGAREAPLPKGYYRYTAGLFGMKKA